MKKIATVLFAVLGTFASAFPASAEDKPVVPVIPEPLFATVNGKPITQKDFFIAFNSYLQQKFYHGKVPEAQIEAAKKEVSERVVERVLLLAEALRRGLTVDQPAIEKKAADYDARYAASAAWQKNRESMLPGLKQQIAEQDLLRQMEAIGRTVSEPDDAAVQEFYKTRIDLFTQPEKLRLHTILLKIDPSASKEIRDAARAEAARIVVKLRNNEASFEDLAALHSLDKSAENGGDMGYLHRGMIPDAVQTQLDERPLGTVGDPVDVLEGVAIFRLDERVPPMVMAYADVAARARELFKRELSNKAWDDFVAGLRKTATIKLFEQAPVIVSQ